MITMRQMAINIVNKIKNPELRDVARRYITFRFGTIKDTSVVTYARAISDFFNFLGEKRTITKEIAMEYIASLQRRLKRISVREYCIKISRALKDLDMVDEQAIAIFRSIKVTEEETTRVKTAQDILTIEEVKKLINNAKKPRDQCLIALLFETGARINELLNIKIGDIIFHEKYAEVIIRVSKTKSRPSLIIESLPYLINWVRVHPFRNDKNAYLFFTNHGGIRRMTEQAVYLMLNRIARECRINKKIYPHLFRHTRLTLWKRLDIQESKIKKMAGLTKDSKALAKYDHIEYTDAKETILALHGIVEKKKKILQPIAIECPRCHAKNIPNAVYCSNCGFLLKIEKAEEVKKVENFKQRLLDTLLRHPEILEILAEKMQSE